MIELLKYGYLCAKYCRFRDRLAQILYLLNAHQERCSLSIGHHQMQRVVEEKGHPVRSNCICRLFRLYEVRLFPDWFYLTLADRPFHRKYLTNVPFVCEG